MTRARRRAEGFALGGARWRWVASELCERAAHRIEPRCSRRASSPPAYEAEPSELCERGPGSLWLGESATRAEHPPWRARSRGELSRRAGVGSGALGVVSRTVEQSVTVGRPEWSGAREWSRRGDADAGSGISRDDRSPVRVARWRGLGTSPCRQGRRALRPPTGRRRRTVGGTGARSGMEGGRASPSAAEFQKPPPERGSGRRPTGDADRQASEASAGVGASDQRERAKEDGEAC